MNDLHLEAGGAPMWNDPAAVHFIDHLGVPWRVVERATDELAGAHGPRCLIFLSEAIVRRVWTYPSNWRGLRPMELEALSDAAIA